MSTTDISPTQENQIPGVPTGILSENPLVQWWSILESSVAGTVASVSNIVGEQIEIAQITANLRKKLVPLLPEFSLSTGINGVAEVNEFAQMVNDLNRIRKTNLAEA